MYLRVLGTDLMILNTAEATHELFEKRSANYSDRSKSTLEVMCVTFQYSMNGVSNRLHAQDWT